MLKCLEAAHVCISASAAKLLKGQLAEATHPTFSFLLLSAITKNHNTRNTCQKDMGCNWCFKVDKKRIRKYNTQQKEAKQQRHLEIFNNELVFKEMIRQQSHQV